MSVAASDWIPSYIPVQQLMCCNVAIIKLSWSCSTLYTINNAALKGHNSRQNLLANFMETGDTSLFTISMYNRKEGLELLYMLW